MSSGCPKRPRGVRPPTAGGYDLIGLGSPVYMYRPPFNVLDYVQGLPDLKGLASFVFVLYGTYRGDTGTVLRHALTRKGAREVGYFHCRGADYFLGYLKQGTLFSPDHPTAEELAQAEGFGRDVAARLAGGRSRQPLGADRDPRGQHVGCLFRAPNPLQKMRIDGSAHHEIAAPWHSSPGERGKSCAPPLAFRPGRGPGRLESPETHRIRLKPLLLEAIPAGSRLTRVSAPPSDEG